MAMLIIPRRTYEAQISGFLFNGAAMGFEDRVLQIGVLVVTSIALLISATLADRQIQLIIGASND